MHGNFILVVMVPRLSPGKGRGLVARVFRTADAAGEPVAGQRGQRRPRPGLAGVVKCLQRVLRTAMAAAPVMSPPDADPVYWDSASSARAPLRIFNRP